MQALRFSLDAPLGARAGAAVSFLRQRRGSLRRAFDSRSRRRAAAPSSLEKLISIKALLIRGGESSAQCIVILRKMSNPPGSVALRRVRGSPRIPSEGIFGRSAFIGRRYCASMAKWFRISEAHGSKKFAFRFLRHKISRSDPNDELWAVRPPFFTPQEAQFRLQLTGRRRRIERRRPTLETNSK